MRVIPSRIQTAAVILALLAAPASAIAQTPAREGKIWNWRDHQPTEAQVQSRERAEGLAPTRPSGSATRPR
jgi:hypothetical protein